MTHDACRSTTCANSPQSWDNRLLAIDLLQPNKTSVLPFVAGSGPAPPVYARANLLFGATEEPYMEEFVVGPLPLSDSTAAHPLSFFSNRQKGSKIRVHDADFATDGDLSKAFLAEAADILKILWNVVRSHLPAFERAIKNQSTHLLTCSTPGSRWCSTCFFFAGAGRERPSDHMVRCRGQAEEDV